AGVRDSAHIRAGGAAADRLPRRRRCDARPRGIAPAHARPVPGLCRGHPVGRAPSARSLASRDSADSERVMNTLTSKDGTAIAFEQSGSGPALILVDGALCSRAFGPTAKLAPLLARHFTVHRYDRRGRGESGDTQPYLFSREIDDLAALIEHS